MTRPPRRPRPADHAPPNTWPHGPLHSDAPPEARLAAAAAARLQKHLAAQTLNRLANTSGIGRQTIDDFLNGKSWPDMRTIARLETALDKPIWGHEHRRAARETQSTGT